MMKFGLEKKVEETRNILDLVDKVHYKNYSILLPEYNEATENEDLVVIDARRNSYFVFDFTSLTLPDDLLSPVYFRILMNPDIHRFEVSFLHDSSRQIVTNWGSTEMPVIFPWIELTTPVRVTLDDVYTRATFRRGKTLFDEDEIIGIVSPWNKL